MAKVTRQERAERQLKAAVARVSSVLIRLFEAAGTANGSDCAEHATLGRELLRDLGFEANVVVGYAAWCIGPDRAGINHVPFDRALCRPGEQGFTYHAWLQCEGRIIDFTTYQFERKARAADAFEGGYTPVTWSPPFLIMPTHRTQSFDAVRRSQRPGTAYYQARPELLAHFEGSSVLEVDQKDLRHARALLANPYLGIAGANLILKHPGPAGEKLRMLEHLMEDLGEHNIPATVDRVAQHLRAQSVPLTDDEAAHLARLMQRAQRMKEPEWLIAQARDLMDTARTFLLRDGQHSNLVLGLRESGEMDNVVLDNVPKDDWPLLVLQMEARAEHRWIAHICECWFRAPDPALAAEHGLCPDGTEVLLVEIKDAAANLYALIQPIERDEGKPVFVKPPFTPAGAGQVSSVLGLSQGSVPVEFK